MDSPKEILEYVREKSESLTSFRILETGCISTRGIAKWLAGHGPHTKQLFTSYDLDGRLQESTHHQLEVDGTAAWCTFKTQDPLKALSECKWANVIFLNPPSLTAGLEQFNLAASTGCSVIVMHDYQAKAAFAIRESRRLGWELWESGRYFTLLRK